MRIAPVTQLQGHCAVPGDKSISHRALLIGAVCDGETRVRGFGASWVTEVRQIQLINELAAENPGLVHRGKACTPSANGRMRRKMPSRRSTS